MFAAEFLVVILAMIIGARWGGIFFGMAGGMGLAVRCIRIRTCAL